jgi:hypothetical protein
MGADFVPSGAMMRIRPGRSVTSMRPSGRNASDHGCTRPVVSTSVLYEEAMRGAGARVWFWKAGVG